MEPAKSWQNPKQKSRSLQSPDFLSMPFSAPSNHQAARSAAKHVHPASRLSRCLRRGLFSLDTSGLIAFLARFPPGNAHLRLALRRLVRQPCGVAPRRPGAQGTQARLKPRRWDSARRREERPGRRKQPAAAEHRAPAWTRLRASSRGDQGDAAARAARRTPQAG